MKLPQQWKLRTLGDFIAELESGVSVNADDVPPAKGEPGVLKVSAVLGGKFFPAESKRVWQSERARLAVTPRRGSILISRSNTPLLVAENAYIEKDYPMLFLSDKLWQTIYRSDIDFDPLWLSQILQSPRVRQQLVRLATGTSKSMKNISKSAFLDLEIPVPPTDEHRQIAKVLQAWDTAIEKLNHLCCLKNERLRGFRQRLLSGSGSSLFKKRGWQNVRLFDVAENVNQRNRGRFANDKLYAVTKAEGMVPMREHVKGENQDRCKIVAQNWFAYNPMRLNIGSIARWKQKEPVMVSGDYVVFRCREQELLPDYLDHLRHSGRWTSFVKAAGNGSVRVRIYFDDLGHLTFPLPPIQEQRRVADVLNACDREIRLLEAQLEALKKQKRGLMQKLLSGEIRVKV